MAFSRIVDPLEDTSCHLVSVTLKPVHRPALEAGATSSHTTRHAVVRLPPLCDGRRCRHWRAVWGQPPGGPGS